MIQVLIVDDSERERTDLAQQFAGHPDRYSLIVAANFHEAVRAVSQAAVHVAIVDVAQSRCDGFELIRDMKKIRPAMQILVSSARCEQSTVMRALTGGVSGYMLKSAPDRDVITAVDKVAAGERYLCPRIAGRLSSQTLSAGAAFTRAGDGVLQTFPRA